MKRFVAECVVACVIGSVFLVASGCKGKKKVGDTCTGDEAACGDKTTILECHDGKLAQMACKGPKGCAERATGATTSGRTVTHNYAVECDYSGNPVGEACLDDGATCLADKSAMIACKDKKIAVTKCLGAKKCSETATQVDCDTTVQPIGEPCEADDFACSPDGKQILKCASGKLAVAGNCRGPKGCTAENRKIGCDSGPQNVGDPCGSDGDYECATDKKALLKCAAGKWKVDETCRGKKTCVTEERSAGCK